ncbi:bifunctional riboflavin kinase/FAD synthetase [Paenarthrobacter sp. Z7-10]|uniref:bifunctional riboflavin kinase/FAD synthetase n=1 Tax=Paenarthrobacter sp. Z7-10 TaxID=2787635 RepID=UPI0022A8DE19|nr:bifunctional riboflavin kinase/FAD synthetase [Paenarthrobacter sp. Z7-10]MCZ2403604.1 bifunctional riboflavin kinase/FAD synthetase [Paenarthrobacter sp. Z7-10]
MVHFWNSLTEVPAGFGPSVVTLGNFDGVHRGHQQVLARLVATARSRDEAAVAITFDPHPAQVHRPDSAPRQIMSLADRLDTMAASGVDAVLVMPYTLALAQQSPEEFVQSVFVDSLAAAAVVIGHDVRFGRGNSGDLATMETLGARLGFDVMVIDEFGADRRCSSTWVREALGRGDVATAAEVLGRPHHMRGEVVHGAGRGRELGFPTANLSPAATGFIPADGIYAGWLTDEAGSRWPAAVSVGSNPTFAHVGRQVEAYVIDRPQERVEDFDLYGQNVVLEFVARLRGMVAYTGAEALVEQMCRDVDETRSILARDRSGEADTPADTPADTRSGWQNALSTEPRRAE